MSFVVNLHDTVAELFDSLLTGPVSRTNTFMEYSITFCSRPEAAIDVMSTHVMHIVADNAAVKCRDLRLNCSREICIQVVGDGIFHVFVNFQLKVASGVISSAIAKV